MRCLAFLLLLATPVLAWAGTSDSDPAPKRGACEYVSAAASEEAPSSVPQARAPIPAASRSGGKPGATSNSGGESELSMPRSRASKWHSFLPGMFR